MLSTCIFEKLFYLLYLPLKIRHFLSPRKGVSSFLGNLNQGIHLKIRNYFHCCLIGCISYCSGCTHKNDMEPVDGSESQLYEFLIRSGFSEENISECSDNFVLDNDWVISKEEVRRQMNFGNNPVDVFPEPPTGVQDRQRVSGTTVVSIDNVQNVSVYVDPSMASVGGVDYRPWINVALSRWEGSASGTKIHFLVASSHSTADLTIIRNNAGASVSNPSLPTCMTTAGWPGSNPAAVSTFPSSGSIGRFISIRFDYGGTNAARVALLMHEIGHSIGFRHNNSGSEGNTTPCGASIQNILLTGTPDNDPSSVMVNPVSSSNTNISSNDQLAARLLYPPSYYTPTITSVTQYSSSLNKVTISGAISPVYYKVVLEVSRVSDGVIMSTNSWNAVNNFEYPIFRPSSPGLYRVRLYGVNYGADFQSNWSGYFNFTI